MLWFWLIVIILILIAAAPEIVGVALALVALSIVYSIIKSLKYRKLKSEALTELGFSSWDIVPFIDDTVIVKSRQALENYDKIKYFKAGSANFAHAEDVIRKKKDIGSLIKDFLANNAYKNRWQYRRLSNQLKELLKNADAYRVCVSYISSAGNNLGSEEIVVTQDDIDKFNRDPSLLMSKSEYNRYLKEQQKEALAQKHHDYYERVNTIIDYANAYKDFLVIRGSQEEVDGLIAQLFDRTVNAIKKIKTVDSEEWEMIGDLIGGIQNEVYQILNKNHDLLEYYESPAFLKIKETCDVLMSTQREFNEYISEKVHSISQLFGSRVVREETQNEDAYNYIRQYKKTITPFTAEVSSQVFSSAENSPLEYVVKNFYPNKSSYPEQIQKLYHLVEELETLRDAKQIIDNYKQEYQQYLGEVPDFVMQNDEAGFYSRLGFADIDERVLTVQYKFSCTSAGGKAQKSFTVPMTEETIVELIKVLESKLSAKAFAKEQRNLMTRKLREYIKTRDNFTCCTCGNSTHVEPNLLLEIDHIIPVAKGGYTLEDNLQTLCWKCNRAKSDKILA